MCKQCENTNGKVHIMSLPSFLIRYAEKKGIEEVVMRNGCLIISPNRDKDGNIIGDYSRLYEIAQEFVKKYNPQKLSIEEYKEAYQKGKLFWMNL